MCLLFEKNPDFFQNFPMIRLGRKKYKNENGKILHYSFEMDS